MHTEVVGRGTVLLITEQSLEFTQGGVQFYNKELYLILLKFGYSPYVLSMSDQKLCRFSDDESLKIVDTRLVNESSKLLIYESAKKIAARFIVSHTPLNQKKGGDLNRAIKKLNCKLIYIYHYNPSCIKDNYRHIYKTTNKGIFKSLIPASARYFIHRVLYRRSLLKALNLSDIFVLLSPTYLGELPFSRFHRFRSKLRVIPNFFSPKQKPECFDKKDNTVLYVGRINQPQKDIHSLIEIWRRACIDLPPDWHLKIVGDGPAKEDVKKIVEDKNIPRVHFYPAQDPAPFYEKAKILMLTSRYEGFGRTLVECQQAAVVPMAFRSYSAVDWILNDKVDAVVVRNLDLNRYAKELISLARRDSKRRKMAINAVKNSCRFNIEVVGPMWERVFAEFK